MNIENRMGMSGRIRSFAGIIATVANAHAQVPAAGAAPPPVQQPATAAPAALPPLGEVLTGTAKEDYAAARLLYDDKDYAGALVKFKRAYDTSKDARLLWNAATCEKNLRHYAKAVALVERYLSAGAPYVTPEVRGDAQTFLDAVKPLTANAVVVCAEPDATVTIDGEAIGTTPLTDAVLVDIGTHRVSVQKDGFKPFTKSIDVAGAGQIRVDATLEKIVHQAHLVVRAESGAAISLDGHGVGSGVWESTVSSGGHSLRVTAPGKQPFQSDVVLQDGESRTVSVTLDAGASGGVPTWVWVVGTTVLVAGAATGGYFLFKPAETTTPATAGTMQPGTVQLPFMR